MISTKQLSIAGLYDIANSVATLGSFEEGIRIFLYCRFVISTISRIRMRRIETRRQADGKVKKIRRGKEDKGSVSREAKSLCQIRDDPQDYREGEREREREREKIESNWNRSIRQLLGSRTFLLGKSLFSPSYSVSSFFRFSRRLDISFARPLILERTKT